MASRGIKDRVAIIGMGCTKFGEHWDKGVDELLVEAAYEAFDSAGVTPDDVDAYWLGTMGSGISGLTLSEPLKIQFKPVTRVENMCATGSEALRQAAYAVASGAFDMAMAIGVEKLKDSGYSGLVGNAPPNDGTEGSMTAPASFSLLAPAYFKKYGLDADKGKEVLSRIAWKNHKNGSRNPKAQFQKEVSMETIRNSPKIADPLGIMDCSGVSDGSAAAIVVRAEDAHKYCKNPIYLKALSFVAGPAEGPLSQEYDFTTFREVVASAKDAYSQAGITNPREQLSMAEVHDCFTPTELVLMEDLGFSKRGTAWQDVMDGFFDLEGKLPVNPDGGLKSFGHPIGASGLRMMYEMWLQLRGEAGPRQLKNPKLGLTHNLGGAPGRCVSFVSVVGREIG
ncbi:MAG TPA: acetyl-CoA acetyltransferase [Candidatus Binataceae bacterium]|nr:acetyl-CoA acetyltransferase [Candidatus Binataceae bacterium]